MIRCVLPSSVFWGWWVMRYCKLNEMFNQADPQWLLTSQSMVKTEVEEYSVKRNRPHHIFKTERQYGFFSSSIYKQQYLDYSLAVNADHVCYRLQSDGCAESLRHTVRSDGLVCCISDEQLSISRIPLLQVLTYIKCRQDFLQIP
jgi:hypothetical protein